MTNQTTIEEQQKVSGWLTTISTLLLGAAGVSAATSQSIEVIIVPLLASAIVSVYNHLFNVATTTSTPSQITPTQVMPVGGTTGVQVSSLGVEVTPSFQNGVSPFTATVNLICSTDVTTYVVNWNDGTTVTAGNLIQGAQYNTATLNHVYNYTQGPTDKYQGHLFQPTIMVSNGATTNTVPAAACNITVQSAVIH